MSKLIDLLKSAAFCFESNRQRRVLQQSVLGHGVAGHGPTSTCVLGVGDSGPRIPDSRVRFLRAKRYVLSHILGDFSAEPDYFLKRLANAWRASVGAPDEVWRSTTVRGTNNSHVLRAVLFTIRAGIVLLH